MQFIEETVFSILHSWLLCCKLTDHRWSGFISRLCSVPLICVSVFKPKLYCFNYYSFVIDLKSEGMVALALLFFLKIALAIWGLLWFHTNFRVIGSVSIKNTIGVLIGLVICSLYYAEVRFICICFVGSFYYA